MKKELFNKLKDMTKEDLETEILTINTKLSRKYIIFTLNSFAFIIWMIVVVLIIKNLIVFLLSLIIGFPIFILSILINLIMLIRDRNIIKSMLVKSISRNFIIARFWYDNKKCKDVAFRMTSTFINYEKGIYIVHEDDIYSNESNQPMINFIYGIPNSIHFDMMSYRNKFWTLMEKHGKNMQHNLVFYDKDKRQIDVTYSAESLQKFKVDKILDDMHTPPSNKGQSILIILVILVLIVLIIIIVILTTKNNNVVDVATNANPIKG